MGKRDGSWDLETSWSSQQRLERRVASVAAASGSMPRSKVVWLEDSVHDVPLQRPELVASILREHIQEGFFS